MLQKPPCMQSNWDNWNCAPCHLAIKICAWLHSQQQNKAVILHCNFWFVSIRLNLVLLAKKQTHFSGNDGQFSFPGLCQFLLDKIKPCPPWQFHVNFIYNHFLNWFAIYWLIRAKTVRCPIIVTHFDRKKVKLWGQKGNFGRKPNEV